MRVELPSLTELEALLGTGDLSDFSLSPVTTPVKEPEGSATIVSHTVNSRELIDEDWPTLADSNIGGMGRVQVNTDGESLSYPCVSSGQCRTHGKLQNSKYDSRKEGSS